MNKKFDLEAAKADLKAVESGFGEMRILCFDCPDSDGPIVAMSKRGTIRKYTIDGYNHKDGGRLKTVTPTITKFINLYDDGPGQVYFNTHKEAVTIVGRDYIKTIEVEL